MASLFDTKIDSVPNATDRPEIHHACQQEFAVRDDGGYPAQC